MPHRSRDQMLCCDCSFSCCIFNDALLFCINLESLKLKTQAAPNSMQLLVFCLTLKKPAHSFFYFSNKSATDTHGNAEFLTSSLVFDPSGGAFTRPLSAKHYAIANGLCRRQEAGGRGCRTSESTTTTPLFFPESICVHA